MIEPALSKEEWAEDLVGEYPYVMVDCRERSLSRHGIAAKLLHEQPFGFTRADVEELREAHDLLNVSALEHLADPTEARLPPEAK